MEARLVNEKRTGWGNPADLLIGILMHEKDFGAAWAAVRTHGASIGVKEALARASEGTHPREALEVHAERVEQLANSGGNPAYAEATKLIGHMAACAARPNRRHMSRRSRSATGASAIS